jgi:uncharacterized protein (DUF58 family)
MLRGGAVSRMQESRLLSTLSTRAHLTVTGAGGLVVIAAGWLAAHALGARSMYLMAYGGVLALLLSWISSRRRLAIDVDRSGVPPRVIAGQSVDVGLRVASRRRVSTLMLEETLPPRLGSPVRLPLASLRADQDATLRYTLVSHLRGVYPIGPLTATWSDPFGMTTHRQVLAEAREMIVHPRVEPVSDRVLTRMWEDPPVRPPVSKPWPVGFEFYGLRDYVAGDDLRRVVWPVVARTGKMMVRESEQGITDRVVVFVDTDAEGHSPGDPSETFEAAIRAAASLGVRHLHDGFAVTLVSSAGRVQAGLRGSQARIGYLDALARLSLTRGTESGVQTLLDEARSGAHFLVFTPILSARTAARLRLVVQRGVSVVLVQMMWDEVDPLSLVRAAAVGCRVVQLPGDVPLEAAFGGRRR